MTIQITHFCVVWRVLDMAAVQYVLESRATNLSAAKDRKDRRSVVGVVMSRAVPDCTLIIGSK